MTVLHRRFVFLQFLFFFLIKYDMIIYNKIKII